MTTVFENFYHDGSNIPLSFRFAIVRSVPFFFVSWTEKRPVSQRKSFCEIFHLFIIRKAFVVISVLGSIDVVVHRHGDDPIF